MEDDSRYQRLLQKNLVALAIGAALVAVCYFWVDRPVAFFVADHHLARVEVLRWLTLAEPVAQLWSPLVLAGLAVRRAWGPLRRGERVLLTACVCLIVADQFKESLKIPFSRLWPDTWINDNPSLIRDGAYGFYPFHGGAGYASFPSGHLARAAAVLAVLWAAYPGGRWAWVALGLLLAAGLVGMNYHFVGDTIGGGFVGGTVGAYAACLGKVNRPPPPGQGAGG